MMNYLNRLLIVSSFFSLNIFSMEIQLVERKNPLVDEIRNASYLTHSDTKCWVIPECVANAACYGGTAAAAIGGLALGAQYRQNNYYKNHGNELSPIVCGIAFPAIFYYVARTACYQNTKQGMWERVNKYIAECDKYVLVKKQVEQFDNIVGELNETNYAWLVSYVYIVGALDELQTQGGYARDLLQKIEQPWTFDGLCSGDEQSIPEKVKIIKQYMENILANKKIILDSGTYAQELKRSTEAGILAAKQLQASAQDKQASAVVADVSLKYVKWFERLFNVYCYGPKIIVAITIGGLFIFMRR